MDAKQVYIPTNATVYDTTNGNNLSFNDCVVGNIVEQVIDDFGTVVIADVDGTEVSVDSGEVVYKLWE